MRPLAALAIIIAALFFSILAQADEVSQPRKVEVGAILPLTGDAASVGEGFKNGMSLGLSKLPESIREQINFHYEDDGLSPKNAVSAFNKLHSEGNLDLVINLSSGTAKPLSFLTEQKMVPLLAVASDPQITAGKKYAFNFWVTPEAEADAAIPEAVKRGYKTIARIVSLQDGTLAVKAAVDKQNSGRLRIVLDEEYSAEVKDFKPFLTKLKARSDVDAIMVALLPGQCGVFARQARQIGIKQDLFGFEMFEDANEVAASGGALVGQWYVNTDDPDNKFIDEYRSKFPRASLFAASNGHDAALLIGAAIEKGYAPGRIVEFLAGLNNFKGALGSYSASGDNRFTLPAAVKVVTEKGFEKLYKSNAP